MTSRTPFKAPFQMGEERDPPDPGRKLVRHSQTHFGTHAALAARNYLQLLFDAVTPKVLHVESCMPQTTAEREAAFDF